MLDEDLKKKIFLGNPKAFYRGTPSEKYKGTFYIYGGMFTNRNWTFYPELTSDGRVIMIDTFWSDGATYIELTNENFNEFKFLFREGDCKNISSSDIELYKPEDVFVDIPLDSGGFSSSRTAWVKKTAKKDKNVLLKRYKRQLDSDFSQLKYSLKQLNELEDELGLENTSLEGFIFKNIF